MTYYYASFQDPNQVPLVWFLFHKFARPPCFFVGWDLRHQVVRPLLAYCTDPNDRWGWLWSNWWNEGWQGKPKYSEKTCTSATLSTTNPTWPDPCANPGRRGGKPATNRLSYGAATSAMLLFTVENLKSVPLKVAFSFTKLVSLFFKNRDLFQNLKLQTRIRTHSQAQTHRQHSDST
jgi:hypothetical protein